MRIKLGILDHLHLDKTYSLLSGLQVRLLYEIFLLLDIHENGDLNDIQFCQFLRHVTDLSKSQIYKVFDMLDVNGSGSIDFDEFYLLACILISIKDDEVKQFIFQHSREVFDLLDADGSKSISVTEFKDYGFLFNYTGEAIKKIFHEFDISGDEEIDFKEFRLFAMACIDAQREMEKQKHKRMVKMKRLQQLSFSQRIRAIIGFWITGASSNVVEPEQEPDVVEEETEAKSWKQKAKSSGHKKDHVWATLTELYTAEKPKGRQMMHWKNNFDSEDNSLWDRCIIL